MFSDLRRSTARAGAAVAVALCLGVSTVGMAQDDVVVEEDSGGSDNGAK